METRVFRILYLRKDSGYIGAVRGGRTHGPCGLSGGSGVRGGVLGGVLGRKQESAASQKAAGQNGARTRGVGSSFLPRFLTGTKGKRPARGRLLFVYRGRVASAAPTTRPWPDSCRNATARRLSAEMSLPSGTETSLLKGFPLSAVPTTFKLRTTAT